MEAKLRPILPDPPQAEPGAPVGGPGGATAAAAQLATMGGGHVAPPSERSISSCGRAGNSAACRSVDANASDARERVDRGDVSDEDDLPREVEGERGVAVYPPPHDKRTPSGRSAGIRPHLMRS